MVPKVVAHGGLVCAASNSSPYSVQDGVICAKPLVEEGLGVRGLACRSGRRMGDTVPARMKRVSPRWGFCSSPKIATTGLRGSTELADRVAIGVPPLPGLLTMLCDVASALLPVRQTHRVPRRRKSILFKTPFCG